MKSERQPAQAAQETSGWRFRKWHLLLLVAGLILRLAFSATVDRESSFGGWDGKEYYAYAQSLLAHQWDVYPRFFNSIRPPFYPIFLVPFVVFSKSVWPIQITQSFIGVFQALLLAHIAGRWRGQRAGNWALAIALLHPFLIYYCAFVLTETLFITLLWLGLACLQKFEQDGPKNSIRWLTYAGLALGLGCLTRAPLQPFLIVAALWIGWRTLSHGGWSLAFMRMAYFTLIVSCLLLPFIVRNYRAHGEATLAPGGGPEMFALGNSPEYLRMYEARTKDEYYGISDRLVTRISVEESASLGAWLDEVRDFRQNHRADWWRLQAYKFKHFWTPWLNPVIFSRTNYLVSLVTTTPLFLLAAVELIRRITKPDPFLVLLLGLVAVGYLVGGFLFHVQVRYRFPFVDVTFIILSASLLGDLTRRITASRKVTTGGNEGPIH